MAYDWVMSGRTHADIGGGGSAVPGAGAAAAGIIGGALNLAGGALANSRARKEAKKNRRFQERMFRNRHQYTVQDMRAAGLNPLLAVTGSVNAGGAPPGATAAQANPAAGIGGAAQGAATAATKGSEKRRMDMLMEAELDLMQNRVYSEQWLAEQYREQALFTKAREVGQQTNNALDAAELPAARSRSDFDSSQAGDMLTKAQRARERLGIGGSTTRGPRGRRSTIGVNGGGPARGRR